MKKAGQLATKNKTNAVKAKINTPKKGLVTPKKVQQKENGLKKGGAGRKPLPAKNGNGANKKIQEDDSDEDDSDEELDNLQEGSGESNGTENGVTDEPEDSSSDEDDDGVSGIAKKPFGKISTKIEAGEDDDDDDDEDEDDDDEDDDEDEEDEEEEDEEEDEDEHEQADGDEKEVGEEQEEDDDDDDEGPIEEAIKKENPKKETKTEKKEVPDWSKLQTKTNNAAPDLGPDNGNTTVNVTRLKNDTTEEDIKNFFKSCGEVKSVHLRKGSRMQCATVKFFDEASKEAALKMHNSILNDGTILVQGSKKFNRNDDVERTITLTNVEKLDKLEGVRLEKIFSECGEIEEMTVLCDPMVLAFITFKSKEGADNAVKLNATIQDGLNIEIRAYSPFKPKTTIFVSNISKDATEADIRKMFESCSPIEVKLRNFGTPRSTSIIRFGNEEDFCKSFLLHDELLLGKRLSLAPFSRQKQTTFQNRPFQDKRPYSHSFQGNRPNSGPFKGKKPYSGPFQGKRQHQTPSDGLKPNSNMWKSGPPKKKSKLGFKGQAGNE